MTQTAIGSGRTRPSPNNRNGELNVTGKMFGEILKESCDLIVWDTADALVSIDGENTANGSGILTKGTEHLQRDSRSGERKLRR